MNNYSKFIAAAEKTPSRTHQVKITPSCGIGAGTLRVELLFSPTRRLTRQRWMYDGKPVPVQVAQLLLDGFRVEGQP